MKHEVPLPDAPAPLRARLYCELHAGTPGDVDFYVRACAGARKILEYGCGAGRIAIELAERGHTVIGVDLDPALLALAAERKTQRETELGRSLPVTFVQGDMTKTAKRGCDRVIIPYSAFWCLEGKRAKRQCLSKARTSLARGGQLVFDVYDADVMADDDFFEDDVSPGVAPAIEQDDYEELHRVKLHGVTYRVWERNTWTRALRSMQVDYRLIPVATRKAAVPTAAAERAALRRGLAPRRSLAPVVVSPAREPASAPSAYQLTLRHSVLWRHELAQLLDECGFEVEWGVDEPGEATPFADQVVVRAVRA